MILECVFRNLSWRCSTRLRPGLTLCRVFTFLPTKLIKRWSWRCAQGHRYAGTETSLSSYCCHKIKSTQFCWSINKGKHLNSIILLDVHYWPYSRCDRCLKTFFSTYILLNFKGFSAIILRCGVSSKTSSNWLTALRLLTAPLTALLGSPWWLPVSSSRSMPRIWLHSNNPIDSDSKLTFLSPTDF